MNNEAQTQFYWDEHGSGLLPILGTPKTALWMRAVERIPTIDEAKLFGRIAGRGPALMLWATVAADATNTARALRRYPELIATKLAHADVLAVTGFGRQDRPSYLDLVDGSHCSPPSFHDFINHPSFGVLSGAVFGPLDAAPECIPLLASHLQGWGARTGQHAERELLEHIEQFEALSCSPVVVVTDSNVRHYWVFLLDGKTAPIAIPAEYAVDKNRFLSWSRIGWDIKNLNRYAP